METKIRIIFERAKPAQPWFFRLRSGPETQKLGAETPNRAAAASKSLAVRADAAAILTPTRR